MQSPEEHYDVEKVQWRLNKERIDAKLNAEVEALGYVPRFQNQQRPTYFYDQPIDESKWCRFCGAPIHRAFGPPMLFKLVPNDKLRSTPRPSNIIVKSFEKFQVNGPTFEDLLVRHGAGWITVKAYMQAEARRQSRRRCQHEVSLSSLISDIIADSDADVS